MVCRLWFAGLLEVNYPFSVSVLRKAVGLY